MSITQLTQFPTIFKCWKCGTHRSSCSEMNLKSQRLRLLSKLSQPQSASRGQEQAMVNLAFLSKITEPTGSKKLKGKISISSTERSPVRRNTSLTKRNAQQKSTSVCSRTLTSPLLSLIPYWSLQCSYSSSRQELCLKSTSFAKTSQTSLRRKPCSNRMSLASIRRSTRSRSAKSAAQRPSPSTWLPAFLWRSSRMKRQKSFSLLCRTRL